MDKKIITGEKSLLLGDSINKAIENNQIAKTYLEKRNKAMTSDTPDIDILHNGVLVRAVQPFMEEFSGGVLINRLDVSTAMAQRLDAMTHNVDEIQEILLIGSFVEESNNNKIIPGRFAKINFNRFKTVRPGKLQGHTDVIYEVPVIEIQGNSYLLIDSRDIEYVIKKENLEKKYYEPIKTE